MLGTTALGFCIWNAADFEKQTANAKRIDLKLPTGVRNISVSLLQSNSIILSKNDEFAVAGVRFGLLAFELNANLNFIERNAIGKISTFGKFLAVN